MTSRWTRRIALVLALALFAGCGGGKGESAADEEDAPSVDEIQRGGSLTYAIEAETGDGWCLQEAQLRLRS